MAAGFADATQVAVLRASDLSVEFNADTRDVASGHLANVAWSHDGAGTYYFIPPNIDPENIKRTGLPYFEIMDTVRNTAGKVPLFLDTCHAGKVMGKSTRGIDIDINAMINELASAENGAVVFASTTGRQLALEDEAWGNGAFTKALLEGMAGNADFLGTGRVTVNMLDLYLSERVKALTHGQQTPTACKPHTIADFPLAVNAQIVGGVSQ
jgi:uncharacterized caspase-like protein